MGLIKLALIGGAGYLAIKKLNEHKDGKQNGCGGRRRNNGPDEQQEPGPYNGQGRGEMSEYFNVRSQPDEKNEKHDKQRYYDYEPDYSQKRQANVTEKQLPSYPQQQQQMSFPPQQQQTSYPNEKQEYQRNY